MSFLDSQTKKKAPIYFQLTLNSPLPASFFFFIPHWPGYSAVVHQFDMLDSWNYYNTHEPELLLLLQRRSQRRIQKASSLNVWTKLRDSCWIHLKLSTQVNWFKLQFVLYDFSQHCSTLLSWLSNWMFLTKMHLGKYKQLAAKLWNRFGDTLYWSYWYSLTFHINKQWSASLRKKYYIICDTNL